MENKNYELYHWGVKGMKWGVRRYQNKDGTLTPAGRKRKRDDYHEDYKKAHDGKSVKYMSNEELRERNKRLNAEAEYDRLKKQTNAGQKAVREFIATAGTIAAITGAYTTYKKTGGAAKSAAKSALKKIGSMKIGK